MNIGEKLIKCAHKEGQLVNKYKQVYIALIKTYTEASRTTQHAVRYLSMRTLLFWDWSGNAEWKKSTNCLFFYSKE